MTTIAVWTLHGSSLSLLRRISRNFAPALHSWTWSWLLLKHLMSSTSWLGTQKRQKLFRRMQMEAAWSSLMSFANGRLPRSCRLQYYTPDTCITASNFRTYHVSRIYHNANRNGEKKREEPKERNKITRYYKYILNIFWIYFEYISNIVNILLYFVEGGCFDDTEACGMIRWKVPLKTGEDAELSMTGSAQAAKGRWQKESLELEVNLNEFTLNSL